MNSCIYLCIEPKGTEKVMKRIEKQKICVSEKKRYRVSPEAGRESMVRKICERTGKGETVIERLGRGLLRDLGS